MEDVTEELLNYEEVPLSESYDKRDAKELLGANSTVIEAALLDHEEGEKNKGAQATSAILKFVGGASKTAAKKVKAFALSEYTKFKSDPKRGPVILLWLSCASCVCLMPALALDFVAKAITFSPVEALVNVYSFAGATLVLAAEAARVTPSYGVRAFLHFYFGFVEFCAGIGALQLLVASLVLAPSMVDIFSLLRIIPGLSLLICGAINVIWGIYAAYKLNLFLTTLQEQECDEGLASGEVRKSVSEKLNLWDRKFEALNKKGDGKLYKEDIREGITELNLSIDEVELSIIFNSLDTDRNGYISKEEFENWWLTKRGARFL